MSDFYLAEAGKIEYDFSVIKSYLADKLESYENLVFTEDTKKEAKDTVAGLRKDKKAFEQRCKDLKEEYMKPYNEFFAKSLEVLSLYDKPIAHINEQIEAFEEDRKAKKLERCTEIYQEHMPLELQDLCTFDKIRNPKWENATYTEKNVADDICSVRDKVFTDLKVIESMCPEEFYEETMHRYAVSFDLNAIVNYINDKVTTKNQVYESIKAKATQDAVEQFIPEAGGREEKYQYTMTLSADAKTKLEAFLDSVGIEWDCMITFD